MVNGKKASVINNQYPLAFYFAILHFRVFVINILLPQTKGSTSMPVVNA